jgi:hypothetical protein
LSDTVTAVNHKVIMPVVYQEHAYFSAIIGINRARGIYHPNTKFERQS